MRVVAAVAFLAVVSAHVVLHHRIFHPSLPGLPYLQRGVISGNPPALQPSPQLSDDLITFAKTLQELAEDPSDVLYQVALQHEGDASEALWDFSSVKACHLSKASAETILLHLPSGSDTQPFALDYFVSPIPHDGSCPQSKSRNDISSSISFKTFASKIHNINTTILFRSPKSPPLPELRAPPPLTQEGEVVKPVPEKSFIQKYWMYIGAFVLVLLVSSGAEDPAQARRGGE